MVGAVSSVFLAKFTVAALLMAVAAAADTPPPSYTNHTVGGPAGWFFNATTNTSAANYSSWAASQTFNLGDYLIFNTNTNISVIQTYNETTYLSCITDDSLDNDTFVYKSGSNEFSQKLTVAVPLTIKGRNYYFSNADDGIQCQHGMGFQIFVNQGLGLPPNLNQPPPPPYIEPPGPDSTQSPPIIINRDSGNGVLRNGDPTIAGFCALILSTAALLL